MRGSCRATAGTRRTRARKLIVYGITELAKHFDEVHVLVVGGNHGEHRVDGKRVNRHDNADCKVFEQGEDIVEVC
jgi:hypothetical protein